MKFNDTNLFANIQFYRNKLKMKNLARQKIHAYNLFVGIADCSHKPLLETYVKHSYGIDIVPTIIDPIWAARKAVIKFFTEEVKLTMPETQKLVDDITDDYWTHKEQAA